MILQKESLREVSFPLGGIGAGCVGLSGNGGLIDWEIFNHPNKGSLNGMTHFAVRVEKDGKTLDARVLHGDFQGSRTGEYLETDRMFKGYGVGPSADTMAGLPHFSGCVFDGEFPCARITFTEPDFPGKAELFAWSPMIPGDSFSASLPCACMEYTITNTTDDTLDYTLAGLLMNPWPADRSENHAETADDSVSIQLKSGTLENRFQQGELVLKMSAENAAFSMQEYLYRGGWCDALEVYWNDLKTPGKFKNRTYTEKREAVYHDGGIAAAHFTLKPGKSKTVRTILTWYVPDVTNTWDKNAENDAKTDLSSGCNAWKNWYATQFPGATEIAGYLSGHYDELKNGTELFRKTLFATTIPQAALDGVSANLSTLKSPTVLRLEDGSIWGWEGVFCHAGSCEGTCQHVWNYAQGLPFFFPDLERSIRRNHLRYSINKFGGSSFRLRLPIGIHNDHLNSRSCADGLFGEIMKFYREWKISGDTDFLRELWPNAKKLMQYAWSKENFDRWDPEQTGLLTGRQHHTLDVELFGPSGWLNGHYLGALKASAEMADAMNDPAFAELCRSILKKGMKKTEDELFNGEYYIQKINLNDKKFIESFHNPDGTDAGNYWDAEHGEIKYQIAGGCSIDSHLGQWYASLYGIGDVLDPRHVRSTLNAIYKYNFVPHLRSFANTWRLFTLDDEGGVIICTWPHGGRPVIPIPYNTETMAGFEWAFACHLIMNGELEKGQIVAEAIRDRYDGVKRNPWNEFECGSNYARNMAACAMLNAYSGFQFDMTCGMIGFAPKIKGDFRCLWSLGTVWGTYERTGSKQIVRILHGSAKLQRFALNAQKIRLNDREQPVVKKDDELFCELAVKRNDEIIFE